MEFELKTTIGASAEAIYSAWLNSEGHSEMTGGEATITANNGDDFTAWDGYIEGKNIDLVPYKRILQSWRTTEFEDIEEDSQLEILLNENNGETELTLIHTNIPGDGDNYEKGWVEHYFEPMKEYFERSN